MRVCAAMGVGMCELACEPRLVCVRRPVHRSAQRFVRFLRYPRECARVRACARSCVRACVRVIRFVCARGCGRACVGEFVGYSCRLSCLLGRWACGARGRTIRSRTCSGRSQRTSFAADRRESAGANARANGWAHGDGREQGMDSPALRACSTRTSTHAQFATLTAGGWKVAHRWAQCQRSAVSVAPCAWP